MDEVSKERMDKIQDLELQWWGKNAIYDGYDHTKGGWAIYDQHFQPYYKPMFRAVADVGCGPTPHVIDPVILASERVAIDPLFDKYMHISHYRRYLKQIDVRFLDTTDAPGSFFDGVFCENALDHVQSPEKMLEELLRICAPGGRLYLYVDVDRDADPMHPHRLDSKWLVGWLQVHFDTLLCEVGKSWKWPTPVLWFVGVKRETEHPINDK